ncbi:hypothetical protein [Sphingomonas jatrophae]|uniref:Uncharacterized protein n=1 Tax=Sphingomonas jatrophae TaxID=1166337 RepID=A0A1I6K6W0_9SPHN|nr:hypothetical protein [Sphingomonas jatrophae]SFR86798.1 hypothetical protein SAMN05192580_1377 [Sphingomonas jatrophae]
MTAPLHPDDRTRPHRRAPIHPLGEPASQFGRVEIAMSIFALSTFAWMFARVLLHWWRG